jgi:hypothetical protein
VDGQGVAAYDGH